MFTTTILVLLTVLFCCAPTSSQAATGVLKVSVSDEDTGQPLPFLLFLTTDKGQGRRIPKVPFWADHHVVNGAIDLKLPLGNYKFEIDCGPEYTTRSGYFQMVRFGEDAQNLKVKRVGQMKPNGWFSADLDIHREYTDVPLAMQAADLDLAPIISWNNSGYNEWADKPLPRPLIGKVGERIVYPVAGRYEVPGCQVNLFNIPPQEIESVLGGSTRPDKRVDSATFLRNLKQKYPEVWIDGANIAMEDLPTLVALGLLDSVEILDSDIGRSWISDTPGKRSTLAEDNSSGNTGNKTDIPDKTVNSSKKISSGRAPVGEYVSKGGRDRDKQLYPSAWDLARWKQDIYFHLLNCGIKIQPSAGSGSGLSNNPLGYNRVFVRMNDNFLYSSFWENYRLGQAVVTNGPLLATRVNGFPPGHTFALYADENGQPRPQSFEIELILSTREPISYIEIIKNGKVAHTVRLNQRNGATSAADSETKDGERIADAGKIPPVEFTGSGWFLVRAVTDLSHTCRYAISAPYFVEFEGKPYIDPKSVAFFQRWLLERGKEIQADRDSWDPQVRQEIVQSWKQARDFWLRALNR